MISKKQKDSIFYPSRFSVERVLEMLANKKDVYRIKYKGVDKPVRFSVKQKRIEILANNPVCSCCGKIGIVFRLVTDLHSQVSKNHYTAKLHLYTEDGDYLNIDHIVPRSYGGKNNDGNIQVMCHTCNQRKADSLNFSGLDFLIEEREDKI